MGIVHRCFEWKGKEIMRNCKKDKMFKKGVSKDGQKERLKWTIEGIFRDFCMGGSCKHPISSTPIDRYSLGKPLFKISVDYDFTLARYAG